MTESPFHQPSTPGDAAPAAADPGEAVEPARGAGEDVDPDVFVDRDDDAPKEQSGEDLEDLVARRPDPPFRTPES